MSRAINMMLSEAEVVKHCAAAGVSISTTEVLPQGGTRLVCTTGDGAETMRVRLEKHVIAGVVKRTPFYSSPLG